MTSKWTKPARAARFRRERRLLKRHTLAESEHADVARRFDAEGVRVALDVGCGDGRLSALLKTARIQPVGVDLSPDLAPRAAIHANVARADARCLPFQRNAFSAAAALCMLYFFDDPTVVLAEIRRVLRPGGLVAVSAPSRDNDPELADVLPSRGPASFNSENAPDLVGQVFTDLQVERWDGPFVRLPTRADLMEYTVGRGADPGKAAKFADTAPMPFMLTKRGALVYARKPEQ